MSWVENQYKEFYDDKGYLPTFFKPHDVLEIEDVCTTITTSSGRVGGVGNILILQTEVKKHDNSQ